MLTNYYLCGQNRSTPTYFLDTKISKFDTFADTKQHVMDRIAAAKQ